MKLLIISHTPHYRKGDEIVGWGATLREIDHLAQVFDEVVHVAPLHSEPAPQSSLPYSARNIRFRAVSPAGGDTLRQKVTILLYILQYIATIREEMKRVDIVHVRCPASISLIALLVLMFSPTPKYRWVKYAGNWHPTEKEAWSYTLQRWILQKKSSSRCGHCQWSLGMPTETRLLFFQPMPDPGRPRRWNGNCLSKETYPAISFAICRQVRFCQRCWQNLRDLRKAIPEETAFPTGPGR